MTSPDTSPVMHNLEGHDDFDVAWPWLNQQLTPGITTVLRVKNESRSMPRVLPGMLLATDRVVVVDNQSDDGTADVARQVAAELGLSDRLVVKDYPFDVSRCGLEHLWTPDRSVHSLAYFYNWSFSHVSTTYSMKWDGDMVLTPEGVAILRDLGWQLDGDVLVTIPRHPLFVESESVAYLDRGTANIEPYVFPMASGYGHVKAFEWELRLHPEDITRLRLPEGLCVELKYLDSDEFAHWTAPDSFADSIRTGRKRREWEVFHGLAEGRWRELGDIERIEAPPGVNVIDYVTERWLPQSHRPVFVGGLEFPVTPGELPIDPDRRGPGGKLLETPEVRQGVRQPADTEEAVDIDGAATPARAARPAEAATVATEELPDASNRRVLMVAGSGRSGTSLLAGIAAQLGLYVPQPEISTDSSNPLGFSEPAWVVEFNDRLLRRELVEVSDARPEAWFTTTRLSAQPRARLLLFEWLRAAVRAGRRARDQGSSPVLVPRDVASGRAANRRAAQLRHDAASPHRGGQQQVAAVSGPGRKHQPHGGLDQPDVVHRARHPRVAAHVHRVRRSARGLGPCGSSDGRLRWDSARSVLPRRPTCGASRSSSVPRCAAATAGGTTSA